jgi:hypothetical protein
LPVVSEQRRIQKVRNWPILKDARGDLEAKSYSVPRPAPFVEALTDRNWGAEAAFVGGYPIALEIPRADFLTFSARAVRFSEVIWAVVPARLMAPIAFPVWSKSGAPIQHNPTSSSS